MTRRDWKIIFIVLAIAFAVRVVGINSFPPGLWMDEGLNGYDAYYTLHDGPRGEATGFQMVYPDIFPREPLLVWILSLTFFFAGPKVLVMRLVMVAIGAMTCAVTYRAVRFIEGSRGLALTAAIVLATMHWHSHFSRLVFRTNLVPLIGIALVCRMSWAAAAERRSGKRGWWRWLLVGMLAGIGFYTYLSWYFFVPVGFIWFWALRTDAADDDNAGNPTPVRSLKHALVPFLAGAILIFSPMLVHYATSPDDLTGRPEAVSPLKDGPVEAVKLIARNTWDVCLMFAVRGDHVQKHNVAEYVTDESPRFGKTGSPVFDPVWAGFFYLGLFLTVLKALRSKGRSRRIALAWLSWLVCMSLPSIVSQTDSANTLRNLGVTPAVAFFAARGWYWIYLKVKAWADIPGSEIKRYSWSSDKRSIAVYCVMALFAWGAVFQLHKAWIRHPNIEGIDAAFNKSILDVVKKSPELDNTEYFYPLSLYDHYSFRFLTITRDDVHRQNLEEILMLQDPPMTHVVYCRSEATFDLFQKFLPEFERVPPFLNGHPDVLLPADEARQRAMLTYKYFNMSQEVFEQTFLY